MNRIKLPDELQLPTWFRHPSHPKYYSNHFRKILEFAYLRAYNRRMWKLNPVPDLGKLQ